MECGMSFQNLLSSLTSAKFKEHYEQLQATDALSSNSSTTHVVKWQKTHGLLHNTDSDESDDDADALSLSWMIEFKHYIDTNDIIPPGMTVVEWWGVHILCCSGLNSYWDTVFHLAQCTSLSNRSFPCPWLSRYHGIFSIKRVCFLFCWNYPKQAMQSAQGRHCWSFTMFKMYVP